MLLEKKINPNVFILITCILGSLVRLLYGIYFTPWLQAPNHLAWDIILQNGGFSYAHLIHYPHEGGTIIISLLSHLLKPMSFVNSLTLAAFVLEFIVRYVQLRIVYLIFDFKIFTAFGIWTIFASAMIIPWATVNFGLHALSSIFPFILLYILFKNSQGTGSFLLTGAILALAFWFSYSNVILIPVYFIYQILVQKQMKNTFLSFASMILILCIHLVVRHYADAGFHLENDRLSSIRGTSFLLNDMATWQRLFGIWTSVLLDSVVGAEGMTKNIFSFNRIIYGLLLLLSLIGFIYSLFKKPPQLLASVVLLMIVLFVCLYAISPFYYDSDHFGNYISYRHFAYVFPLLSLFVFTGLRYLKGFVYLSSLVICLALFSTITQFSNEKPKEKSEMAAGWVLGVKFGHDVQTLNQIISSSNYQKNLLFQGVAWGMSKALFEGDFTQDQNVLDQNINDFLSLLEQFPSEYREDLLKGIDFAFGLTVTPGLNQSYHDQLKSAFKQTGFYNY